MAEVRNKGIQVYMGLTTQFDDGTVPDVSVTNNSEYKGGAIALSEKCNLDFWCCGEAYFSPLLLTGG